jgi:4'-phosphopantetheinyl transferase
VVDGMQHRGSVVIPAHGPDKSMAGLFGVSGRNIHVWSLPIDEEDTVVAPFEKLLRADEIERADAFRLDRLRHSFVLVRGVLRILLANYLRVSPAGIQLVYGAKGKPALSAPANVRFNVSHSGGLAVFAFAQGCELGIDVERIREVPDMQSIARHSFCPEEAVELMSLDANERERAFFLCWTRKEAYLKAVGDGLSAPLDSFRVTLQPGHAARFIHINHDMGAAEAWTLDDLRLAPDYAAGLAYRDTQRSVVVLPRIAPSQLARISEGNGFDNGFAPEIQTMP